MASEPKAQTRRRGLWQTVLFGIVRPFGTKCPEVDGSIDRKSEENIMSFRYDLTAVDILKLLGYTEPVGKNALLQAEHDKGIKLPPALFEFWSLTAD